MNSVSCDICVYHLDLSVFSPWVFLSSRVTRTCPVTTDLITLVNVRRTTTTTTLIDRQKGCDGLGQRLEVSIQGTIRGWHRVAAAVRRGGTTQIHPCTAGRFPCDVENVSRSGVPCIADFYGKVGGKKSDRPRTCVKTTPRGDRDLEEIRGR